ncbi:hypothetical protein SZN_20452 [Streptomyces zinciresistens K42]|uniref:Uncharacterized protein n=1 Tax=Streptomyces zinciresistens K42 TaxID=700597 RepID=G2GF07_9ACTN|nr:hypothetical protein [Streptomyces zinciresistens]EGX57948.1 hypothetical protein SZN_20452 [Streptomyces zinciresistens K42]
MRLSLAAQALYMSMHTTGDLLTPSEVEHVRDEAVTRLGGPEAVGFATVRRLLFCAAAEPDDHSSRFTWARDAASLVEAQP